MNEWHDISEIDAYKKYYQFSDFVVLVYPKGGGFSFTRLVSGIALMPEGALRFFIVPEDKRANNV